MSDEKPPDAPQPGEAPADRTGAGVSDDVQHLLVPKGLPYLLVVWAGPRSSDYQFDLQHVTPEQMLGMLPRIEIMAKSRLAQNIAGDQPASRIVVPR